MVAREKPREEKCSWDSGVDDQTPRQREKQQRRRRQKQRAALAVAEGGMPFIFSSLSSTSEALSHIFPAEARPRGGFLARRLDAHLTENPAAGALLAVSYAFPRRSLWRTVSLTGIRQTRRLRKPISAVPTNDVVVAYSTLPVVQRIQLFIRIMKCTFIISNVMVIYEKY